MTKKYKNCKKMKIKKALISEQEFYALIEDLTDDELNQVYDWLLDRQRKP